MHLSRSYLVNTLLIQRKIYFYQGNTEVFAKSWCSVIVHKCVWSGKCIHFSSKLLAAMIDNPKEMEKNTYFGKLAYVDT